MSDAWILLFFFLFRVRRDVDFLLLVHDHHHHHRHHNAVNVLLVSHLRKKGIFLLYLGHSNRSLLHEDTYIRKRIKAKRKIGEEFHS